MLLLFSRDCDIYWVNEVVGYYAIGWTRFISYHSDLILDKIQLE